MATNGSSLFSQNLFLPNQQLLKAFDANDPAIQNAGNVNFDGGQGVGNILQDANSDFKDPDKIAKVVDNFSRTAPGGDFLLGTNPNSLDVFSTTNGQISSIFDRNGLPIFRGSVFTNFAQPVPFLGINPDANAIMAATDFFQAGIQAVPIQYDPNRSNPTKWVNPAADNILFGSTSAINTLLSGGNLSDLLSGYPSIGRTSTNAAFPLFQVPQTNNLNVGNSLNIGGLLGGLGGSANSYQTSQNTGGFSISNLFSLFMSMLSGGSASTYTATSAASTSNDSFANMLQGYQRQATNSTVQAQFIPQSYAASPGAISGLDEQISIF